MSTKSRGGEEASTVVGSGISHSETIFTVKNAVKVGLLWAAEYALLSLIEDAPRIVKWATLVFPLAGLAAMQFENKLRTLHRDLFGASLTALTVIYLTIAVIFGFIYMPLGTEQWQQPAQDKILQNELNETQQQLSSMTAIVQSLLKSPTLSASTQRQASSITDLKALSDGQLRLAGINFADELRKFAAEFHLKESHRVNAEWAQEAQLLPMTETNRTAISQTWQKDRADDARRLAQYKEEYNTRFRKQVVMYRSTICDRLEFTSPCPDNMVSRLIDTGLLAGLDPVGEIADYLTLIASGLHDNKQ